MTTRKTSPKPPTKTRRPNKKPFNRGLPIRIRVQSTTKEDVTVLVRVLEEEKRYIMEKAERLGYEVGGGTSTFMRDVGLEAAGAFDEEISVEDRLRKAASEAGMAVGEWLRVVTLAALGYTPLVFHIARAREALEKNKYPHGELTALKHYATVEVREKNPAPTPEAALAMRLEKRKARDLARAERHRLADKLLDERAREERDRLVQELLDDRGE